MIKWHKNLYIGESIGGSQAVTRFKIAMNKSSPSCFCILFTQTSDMPEIVRASMLKNPWYRQQKLTIIGIAEGKSEALEVMRQIFDEVYQQTGMLALKEYFAIS